MSCPPSASHKFCRRFVRLRPPLSISQVRWGWVCPAQSHPGGAAIPSIICVNLCPTENWGGLTHSIPHHNLQDPLHGVYSCTLCLPFFDLCCACPPRRHACH